MGRGFGVFERPGLFLTAADLPRGAEVLLYGAGGYGRRTLALLRAQRPDVRPLAYVDRDKAGAVDGLPVLRPGDPALHAALVLIATPAWHGVAVRLHDAGVRRFAVPKVCDEADHPVKTYTACDGRLVYVRNAKAASESLLHALAAHGPVTVRDGFRDQPLYGADAPDGALAFSFVRNPFDRAVSAYGMAFGGGFTDLGRTLLRLTGREELSFDAFCELLALEPGWAMDSHLRPQSCYIPEDAAFVGRLERIGEDVARLSDLAGVALDVPHKHRSRRPADYRAQCGPAARRILERVYARDLDRFGYAF